MILNIINARYLHDYVVELEFDNDITKMVDLRDTIFNDPRPIFLPLREVDYFKNFELTLNTIAWENGLDLAPEYLISLADVSAKVVISE